MSDLPTGTVTLLFTDIEGSTRLVQHLGRQYAEVLSECRSLLRSAFQRHHGHEVDTQGDASFVALFTHAWSEDVAMWVRMGLHTGEPQRSAEGCVGLDVHRSALIMRAGHGDQVLLSQTTHDLVGTATRARWQTSGTALSTMYTSDGSRQSQSAMDSARGAHLPLAAGFRLRAESPTWMQCHLMERSVQIPAEELGGGLTLSREGQSGRPYRPKPARSGFGEDWSIYPP